LFKDILIDLNNLRNSLGIKLFVYSQFYIDSNPTNKLFHIKFYFDFKRNSQANGEISS